MSVQGQAPTGQPVPPPAGKPPARRNPIVQYVVDSYNGLYKIVIEPSMPTKQTVILLIVGLIIGLIWGWVLSPVKIYDAGPNALSEAARDQWIKSIAVAHDTQTFYPADRAEALLRVVPDPSSAINRMIGDVNTEPADLAALQNIQPIANAIPVAETPAVVAPGSFLETLMSLLLPILIILIATPILVVVWRLLIYDNIIAPILRGINETRNPDLRVKRIKEAEERQRIRDQRAAADALRKESDAAAAADAAAGRGDNLGPAVMQALYIYSKGRSFDESSEIELKTGEFLGQCGAVIAEAVDPDPTAIEVWLFDMFDQLNLKKVLITETAYGNPSIRAAVEDSVEDPANDVIVATPGAAVILETQKLRLQAKLAALTVSPDGRFDNFNLQLQAWNKDKASAPIGAPAPVAVVPSSTLFEAPPAPAPLPSAPLPSAPAQRPITDYDDLQFDPPPPLAAPRPAPVAPPPARPITDYDDIQFDPPPVAPLRPASPPPAPAQRPITDYDDIQFDPPPIPGGRPPAPPIQPLRPSAPPPAPGFGDEDDPFGNTGDFTPLGNGR